MKEEKKESRWKGIIMLVLGFIFMLPVLLIVMNSFKTGKEILTNFVSFPTSLYLDNFTRAMKTMRYASSFMNSAIITILTVIISLTVSYLAAYGILHLKGKLSSGFYIFFILGQVIPFHAVMIAITIMAKNMHLNNSLLGLALMYGGLNCGFGIMTYMGFLKSVPTELEEAAMIDGCGAYRSMMQIVFPLLKPATVTLGVLYFLWCWNDFVFPNIMLGKEELRTITMNLYVFRSSTNTEWDLFIAGLTVSLIPIVIIYILAQKHITSGLTAGAIK